MKLAKCAYGVLVTDGSRVGMVVGTTNNKTSSDLQCRDEIGNAIPLVSWSAGNTSGIHHGNLEAFKGE